MPALHFATSANSRKLTGRKYFQYSTSNTVLLLLVVQQEKNAKI